MYKMLGCIEILDGQWSSITNNKIIVKDYADLQECMKAVGVQHFIVTLIETEGDEINE